MGNKIDWNLIELTEIYETYDMALRLLDEDFTRICRLIDAAIKHGADLESMTGPLDNFTIEVHRYCNVINGLKDKKQNKTQNP